jgi:hypothetical protein
MTRRYLTLALIFLSSPAAFAQVTVSPDNITAYSQGATSSYLTFNGVVNLTPAEATWCGDIVPAAPDIGFRCDPTTIFGVLPTRYDQSHLTGSRYTDIMSISPVVARRAYTDATQGNDSRFFYVKHFVSTNGGPDQFIPVTIRLSGNGAGVPFSLTGVNLKWQDGKKVVPFIKPGEKLPAITAEIRYTGTGRLKGRWEIVRPGEELPTGRDLLSEAALPIEERGLQRRYTFLSRFNVNLPPGGRYTLPGPENWQIDKTVQGMYLLLFRVEASDASNSASNIGTQTIATGGVAGFQMPTLRYYIGNSSNASIQQITGSDNLDETLVQPIVLRWKPVADTKIYRLEIQDEDKIIFSSIALPSSNEYTLPSFIRELAAAKRLKWRVVSIDAAGKTLDESSFADVK